MLRVHGQGTYLLVITGQNVGDSNHDSKKEGVDGRRQNWESSIKRVVELLLPLFYQVANKTIVSNISRYDVTVYVYHLRIIIKNKNETKNYWEV